MKSNSIIPLLIIQERGFDLNPIGHRLDGKVQAGDPVIRGHGRGALQHIGPTGLGLKPEANGVPLQVGDKEPQDAVRVPGIGAAEELHQIGRAVTVIVQFGIVIRIWIQAMRQFPVVTHSVAVPIGGDRGDNGLAGK
jgi:hypothetical protein